MHNLLTATANATGLWFYVELSGEYVFAQRASDDLGGGTLYIEMADGSLNLLGADPGLTSTTVLVQTVILLCRGQHVRVRLAAATNPSVHVSVWPTVPTGAPALVEVL